MISKRTILPPDNWILDWPSRTMKAPEQFLYSFVKFSLPVVDLR